jgi:hypothetical protein
MSLSPLKQPKMLKKLGFCSMVNIVHRFLVPVNPVTPITLCENVFHLFSMDKFLQSFMVVQNDEPIGLATDFHLIDRFSRNFFREFYVRLNLY